MDACKPTRQITISLGIRDISKKGKKSSEKNNLDSPLFLFNLYNDDSNDWKNE